MDQVDIEDVEDINELEARLYAQIHHEATEKANVENAVHVSNNDGVNELITNSNTKDASDAYKNYETSSNTNRILSRRYWASGENSKQKQQTQQYQQNTKQRFIRNPFKTPNSQNDQYKTNSPSYSDKSQNEIGNQSNIARKTNDKFKSAAYNSKLQADETTTPTAIKSITTASSSAPENTTQEVALATSSSSSNENKINNKNGKITTNHHPSARQKMPVEKSNLKLNPVADWMKKNKNRHNKKANDNNIYNVIAKNLINSTSVTKQGPFARQQQKLQKAKRLEEKKQKSKKAKITAAASKIKSNEIIDLDTDNESDSSDVIMILVPPPPTYTVDDSGDEGNKAKVPIVMQHEENALDSTDVQMSSTSISFIKPQALALTDCAEKRLDNSSRCTSPCSIQSSDDFIGHTDRSRLLAGASRAADDEDLLVLTTDMNSLLQVPESARQAVDEEIAMAQEEGNLLDPSVEQMAEENVATNDSLEFATPKSAKQQSLAKDYRVDQGQFRALDVYESESDITDSVYSKGAHKTTVVRQIDTSSDGMEDIGSCNSQRTKRLRKRRASSSNKESDPNNENSLSSSDNEADADIEEDDNEALRTDILFIAKGPAVERFMPRKRSRTVSSCSPNPTHKRKTVKTSVSTGNMSDTEFMATLNNLAQGQDGEAILEEADESETENIPTARDIAEKILAQHSDKQKTNEVAVPEEVLNQLDKVFEAIDQLDSRGIQSSALDETVKISSDSSDSNREMNIKYKSSPHEDVQIIEYSAKSSTADKAAVKAYAKNGSPIYNVIYSRGQRRPGGMGWNDEMRRFYNNSWNGEHFLIHKVLQKMNPDKTLWKIYTDDRFNIKPNKRHNKVKCTNCCEFGHIRSKCKRPRKPMICYMCGDSGHYEPRCPNTICLRCGNKTQVFTKSCNACSYQNRLICPICKIRGHSLDYCPDKWRRYHSTTEANTQPNSSITYNTRKFCCICGGHGHLSDNCRSAVRFMEYPPIVSNIKSHQKAYSDVVVKTPHNGIALNLMYDPCKEYNFDLVEATSFDKYYGRFLKAVDMDLLLKRKRNISEVTTEIADTTAERDKRLSKKYVANPYSKVGTANQQTIESMEKAPNQVQEITESGNIDEEELEQVMHLDDNSVDNEIELVGSTVDDDDMANIQINTINERPARVSENFKSPKNVTLTSKVATPQTEPPLILDSDSNYSFSEHFDVEAAFSPETQNVSKHRENARATADSRPKPRQMEALPDFIPLRESTDTPNDPNSDNENSFVGISRRFIPLETDDEMEEDRRTLSPLSELPCEAKIYLTHFHSKYLLSPAGNAFLVKTSRAHKLKARLDFTSIGHVLVIFGLPSSQDKFQRELLMKYRELADESNQKQVQSNLNVPKRTDVLIKFLRESITQLLHNIGNVNLLLKRLQILERQQSKSGFKLAERVRRSLNMILVGQAGLQDGTMHLDKLLMSLKTLINDFNSEDVTPPQLRSEITDHWKMIFTPYRHENYQQLVNTYNRLISKNRMPRLNIDPILLGQKVLDTKFTEQQKQNLEHAKPLALLNASSDSGTDATKQVVPNPLNQKMLKPLKRKQNTGTTSPSPNTATITNKTKTPTSRPVSPAKATHTTISTRIDNSNSTPTPKTKQTSNNSSTPLKHNKTTANTSITVKTKTSSSQPTPTANKSKQSTSANNSTPTSAYANATPKKQLQKIVPPPPFANPQKRSTVSTSIQEVSDKWKSTCDTLLTEISADKSNVTKDGSCGKTRDSKQPSAFWSRESMRYLNDCLRLAAVRPNIVEKLQRVQDKSKTGQLSYNDYLAVIKLHTTLNGK